MSIHQNKKIYFASDFHLGMDGKISSIDREKKIVQWLTSIQENAEEIYLVGDIFDYWFEYKRVIPKGFTRILGKLATLADKGIKMYFFSGNHDLWMYQYLTDEMGIPIYHQPIIKKIRGKNFYIGHGDGLGPGDHGYKVLKSIMSNKLCQRIFSMLHPNLAIKIMRKCSQLSRESESENVDFLGIEKEWLIAFVEEHGQKNDIDYYVFGHRHLLLQYHLTNHQSLYYNLGDWLTHQSYLEFDGINDPKLRTYETDYKPLIIRP